MKSWSRLCKSQALSFPVFSRRGSWGVHLFQNLWNLTASGARGTLCLLRELGVRLEDGLRVTPACSGDPRPQGSPRW